MSNSTGRHLLISGRVQGVGFRNFTRSRARKLGLSGWVRNLDDGRVEVQVCGPEESLSSFIEMLTEGPPAAYVKDIEQQETTPQSVKGSFSVRY